MRKLLALLAVVILIAGCTGQSTGQADNQTSGQEPVKVPSEKMTGTGGIIVSSAPDTVVENSRFLVTWKVATLHPETITKTQVYYDRLSHAGDAPTAITPSMLKYPSFTPSQKSISPATFTDYIAPGAASGDMPGKTYFRAYALIDGLNYWSDEYMVTVMPKPSVAIADFPSKVGKSSTFGVKWSLKNGYPGAVSSTYVTWGLRSGEYTSSSKGQTGSTPASFEAVVTAPSAAPETLYFVVKSTVDGAEYVSAEKTVSIY